MPCRLFGNDRHTRGQGMTEYILVVALVAIGAIAFVSAFGNNVRALLGKAANAIAGQPSGPAPAPVTASPERDLTNFDTPP
jgi:Flp pilus assembly pilin Flp